jgi:hypothetical protein
VKRVTSPIWMFSTLPELNCVKPPSKPWLGHSKLPQCMITFCLFSDYCKKMMLSKLTIVANQLRQECINTSHYPYPLNKPHSIHNKWNAHTHVYFLTEVLIIGYDVRWLDMHTSQYWKASEMDSTTQNTKRW